MCRWNKSFTLKKLRHKIYPRCFSLIKSAFFFFFTLGSIIFEIALHAPTDWPSIQSHPVWIMEAASWHDLDNVKWKRNERSRIKIRTARWLGKQTRLESSILIHGSFFFFFLFRTRPLRRLRYHLAVVRIPPSPETLKLAWPWLRPPLCTRSRPQWPQNPPSRLNRPCCPGRGWNRLRSPQ